MNRYFVAIPIPLAVCNRLSLLRGNLPNARWVAPEDYHLTLRFVGDCETPALNDLFEGLSQITRTRFDLQLEGMGIFGHAKPRAIWIGAAPNAPLADLKAEIDTAARFAGIELDGRKFTPHVTLARLSNTRQNAVAVALEAMGNPLVPRFSVDAFGVYSSGRSRGGGPYVLEESFSLEPAE